ncbi:hypothetical protein ACFL5N_01510 [bacterium]
MEDIKWIPYQDCYLKSYQDFVKNNFGRDAYQSKKKYIDWLYSENPLMINKKNSDFLVGINKKKEVIACIHKMRLLWNCQESIVEIPAIHNLMVDKKYRMGIGFMLVINSIIGEEHAFIPGVVQPFSEFYRKLKYQKVNTSWYRYWVKPIQGPFFFVLNRFLKYSPSKFYFNIKDYELNDYKVTMNPDDKVLQQLVSCLNSENKNTIRPYWTIELIKWRFFNKIGPRHVLIYKIFQDTIKNFIILSLGPRKGINIGRILLLKIDTVENLKILLDFVKTIIKNNGGHLLQLFFYDSEINIMLKKLGWKNLANPPDTYFYHKNRDIKFKYMSFFGAVGDFGFEGLQ